MEKTNVIVGGSNVNGNIGSCEIKSNSYQKSLFYVETAAVNSCTGEIISKTTYWDSTWLWFGLIVIIVIVWAKWLFD